MPIKRIAFVTALIISVVFLVAFLSGCQSTTTPKDIENIADSIYKKLNDSENTASASVLVVKDEEKILKNHMDTKM